MTEWDKYSGLSNVYSVGRENESRQCYNDESGFDIQSQRTRKKGRKYPFWATKTALRNAEKPNLRQAKWNDGGNWLLSY